MRKVYEMARPILRPVYRPLRRVVRFTAWIIPSLRHLLLPDSSEKKRILAIYDTTSQPFSIGDILICQEASLVLCQKHGADVVDFAIVYDPMKPDSSNPVFEGTITDENIIYHLASILPVAQVNQRLGSVYIFNSQDQLQSHIHANMDRYHIWPSGWKVAIREYMSPAVFNDLLYAHYKEHGSIPELSCRPFLKTWAMAFFREHAKSQVPVTVNIRNNPGWHTYRNSKLDSWIAFFQQCEHQYSAKFIVICARSEIDERLRNCSNVILAKDYQTGVEQDMALIHASAIHMGANSGPATMAWFTSKPYLMVNTVVKIGDFYGYPDMIKQEELYVQRFWFAGLYQRIANQEESAELLAREFALMWNAIDVRGWQAQTSTDDSAKVALDTWLR